MLQCSDGNGNMGHFISDSDSSLTPVPNDRSVICVAANFLFCSIFSGQFHQNIADDVPIG